MHLKNFSMILDKGVWKLAPAYDLLNVAIVNPDDQEELALTIDGRKSKFNRERMIEFGKKLGMSASQIKGVFNRMLRNENGALEWIQKSFLSDAYKEKYTTLLTERYHRIRN